MSEHRAMAQSVVDEFRRVQDEPGEDFTVTLTQDQARFIGRAMGTFVRGLAPPPEGGEVEAVIAEMRERAARPDQSYGGPPSPILAVQGELREWADRLEAALASPPDDELPVRSVHPPYYRPADQEPRGAPGGEW